MGCKQRPGRRWRPAPLHCVSHRPQLFGLLPDGLDPFGLQQRRCDQARAVEAGEQDGLVRAADQLERVDHRGELSRAESSYNS
eukprot:SAG22_NODE_8665_length_638_cov_1.003711_2_plen_83_part_00